MSQSHLPPSTPQKQPPSPTANPGMDKLKAERVELMLASLPGWKLVKKEEAIQRQFDFAAPGQALAFAGLICGLTARWQHRPEVRISSNTTVTFHLSTPEAGGLTLRDFQVARRLSQQS